MRGRETRPSGMDANKPYDPVFDTKFGRMLGILMNFEHMAEKSELCTSCYNHLYNRLNAACRMDLVRGCGIDNPATTPSCVTNLTWMPDPGASMIQSTLTSIPVRITTGIQVRHEYDARTWYEDIDCAIDMLGALPTLNPAVQWEGWDDLQAMTWFIFAGGYTMRDFLAGRSFKDYLYGWMSLLNVLHRVQRSGHKFCLEMCFPTAPRGYPFGGIVSQQSSVVVAIAMDFMDPLLVAPLHDALELGDLPDEVRAEGDMMKVMLWLWESDEVQRKASRAARPMRETIDAYLADQRRIWERERPLRELQALAASRRGNDGPNADWEQVRLLEMFDHFIQEGDPNFFIR